MSDGFLSRWSQRKQDVRQGKPLVEPVAVNNGEKLVENAIYLEANSAINTGEVATKSLRFSADNKANNTTAPGPSPEPLSAPTLDDVSRLDALTSDFKPFVARGVAPDIKNAAMKKLFTDPHFNVMDGMDVYIDDYSVSTPIPESILRQMTSAKFLGLFDDDEKKAQEKQKLAAHDHLARDDPNSEFAEPMPQSEALTMREALPPPVESTENLSEASTIHDHPDMQLQPDHVPGARAPGRGAG